MDDYIINKNRNLPDSMNYEKLRELGMEYIRQIGGKIWTDHNVHDPGVTTLELLCYAITDLGYRTSFDMKDILTPEGKDNFMMEDHFIRAEEILPSHPLTINDYRKLLLEHFPMLSNVFLKTVEKSYSFSKEMANKYWNTDETRNVRCKGYYRVQFHLSPEAYNTKEYKNQSLDFIERDYVSKISSFLAEHRNMCEDVDSVIPVKKRKVGIEARIEISDNTDNEDKKAILKKIYRNISNYVNVAVPRYSLEEMLDKGKTVDEIFQGLPTGPLFVDEEDLNKDNSHCSELYLSDIVNIIMSVPEVVNIQCLYFVVEGKGSQMGVTTLRMSDIEPGDETVFMFDASLSTVCLCCDGNSEILKIKDFMEQYEPSANILFPTLDIPKGEYRETDSYFSFQNDYPAMYHLGKNQLWDNKPEDVKTSVMQFKAYLTFFDQLLADYLSQLSSIKYLYSWQDHSDDFDQDKSDTYFYNKLTASEIDNIDKLNIDYSRYNNYQESNKVKYDRKGRFLDHLIARFNENFVNYSINEYRESGYSRFKGKRRFLASYARISINRTHAVNLNLEPGHNNRNYLEERILSKLGIHTKWYMYNLAPIYCEDNGKYTFSDNRKVDINRSFGVRIYEHSALMPDLKNGEVMDDELFIKMRMSSEKELLSDPYSMYITAVLPGWLNCSMDVQFRNFVENIIREETPAHVMLRICWTDPYQMMKLEEYYDEYMQRRRNGWDYKESLKKLVDIFNTLRNMRPYFRLYHPLSEVESSCSKLCEGVLGGDVKETSVWEFAQKNVEP